MMRYVRFAIAILGYMYCSVGAYAQAGNAYAQPRILVLLDESASMIKDWQGDRPKHLVAADIVMKLMDSVYSVNPRVEFSLRVFGHQHTVQEHDCYDTHNEVPFSKENRTQMQLRMEDIQPLGVTAIAYSLSRAAEEDLVDQTNYVYSIVLITDGGESCNGDICNVMATLLKSKIFFRPYVLSLEDLPGLKKEYECLGNYLPVTKKEHINAAVGTIVEAFRPMLRMTKLDYKQLMTIKAPSVLNISVPHTKVEKKVDSVPAKPAVTNVPPVKTLDTMETRPPVKTSKITVGEELKLPPKIKLTRPKLLAYKALFVAPIPPLRLGYAKIVIPNIPLADPDLPKPVPTALTLVRFSRFRPFPVAKVDIAKQPKLMLPEPNITLAQPPVVIPEPTKLRPMYATLLGKLPVERAPKYKPTVLKFVAPALILAQPDLEPLAPPTHISLVKPAFTSFGKLPIDRIKRGKPSIVKLPTPNITLMRDEVPQEPPPVVVAPTPRTVEIPPAKRERVALPRLRPTKVKMHLLYGGVFFDTELKLWKLPPPPALKPIAIPTTTPTTSSKPNPTEPEKTVKGEYTVSVEDAKETMLEVYLTNGKGKYYHTTPQLRLLDQTNNRETKRFYRTVDPDGNPDPINNIAAGKYNIGIVGSNLIFPVEIMPGKKNRVNIIVKPFSLAFRYENAPERPVNEFTAVVIQRNVENGKITTQKCTERLEYEPGNYHISINTMPEEIRNIDLDLGFVGVITIDQPGFAKFVSEETTGSISLWVRRGERYLSFYNLKLADPRSQHFQLQPGFYQVHYTAKGPKMAINEKVLNFVVKSKEETEVVLVK